MATDHLEGKRTGRPKGSKNGAMPPDLRRDVLWAYRNLSAFTLNDGKPEPIGECRPKPPSPGAMHWVQYGLKHPERFLDRVVNLAHAEEEKQSAKERDHAVVDEGRDRALSLIESLLDDFHREEAEKDAQLAAQPGTAALAGQLQRALKQSTWREGLLRNQVDELREKVKE